LLARHRAESKELRAVGEINRLADLEIQRVEFVHAAYGGAEGAAEFSALLTFQAISYRLHEQTRQPTHGCQERRTYQEFWTFRRGAEGWQLTEIRPSRDGTLLERPITLAATPAPAQEPPSTGAFQERP